MCPRTNDALSAFISASAPAVTWSPVEAIAEHLEAELCDSSPSSTNHRFKTTQYLMCERTSNSVGIPTCLLSCKARTERKGYLFQHIFRPYLGESLFVHFSASSKEDSWAQPFRWVGKWKKQVQGFILRKKNLKETDFFQPFPIYFLHSKAFAELWHNPNILVTKILG